MASFFPKALVFKEWRELWVRLALAAAVMVFPSLWTFLLQRGSYAADRTEVVGDWLARTVYGVSLAPHQLLSGHPGANMFLAIVAILLAVLVVGYDRRQGGLWYTLSGPVHKASLYRVRYTFGAVTLLIALTLLAILVCLADMSIDLSEPWYAVPWAVVAQWYLLNAAVLLLSYTFSFAVVQMVGTMIGAAILSFLVLSVPAVVGHALRLLGRSPLAGDRMTHPLSSIGDYLMRMSPLFYAAEHSVTATTAYNQVSYFTQAVNDRLVFGPAMLLTYCAMVAVLYFIGRWLFHKAPVENYGNLLIFPRLWHLALFVVSTVAGVLLSILVRVHGPLSLITLRLIIWTVVLWGILEGCLSGYYRFVRRGENG